MLVMEGDLGAGDLAFEVAAELEDGFEVVVDGFAGGCWSVGFRFRCPLRLALRICHSCQLT
jgi:hypothetical protein